MKTSIKIMICAALAFCLPALAAATAGAEYYVPPENSAVNQYTQTIPSAGGDKSGEGKEVSASEALGEKNAKRLQKQGPEGAAAAALAAQTAPAPVEETEPTETAETTPPTESGAKKPKKHLVEHQGGQQGHHGGAAAGGDKPAAPNGPGSSAAGDAAKGGSAVGEVASRATGLSGGALGIFLPLVILAAIVWAAAYLWRRHAPGPGSLPR